MIWRMYAVYDKAAAVYTHPFCCRTEGEAVRAFSESVNGGNPQMSKWHHQFSLMYIGAYDDSSAGGSFLGTGPELVIDGTAARNVGVNGGEASASHFNPNKAME